MEVDTKYFGRITVTEADVFHFSNGLFGFEEEKQFLLLPFAGGAGNLLCFQSVKTAGLAFVAMNPFSLKDDYAPILQKAELQALGVQRSEDLCYYVLCVVRNPVSESTVNLKCPVVINEDTHQAAQVILESGDYEMRHLLSQLGQKEEKPC